MYVKCTVQQTVTTETVFKEKHGCMGLYARVDYNSPVNSVVSYPPTLQRERGGVGKISPIVSVC
jgi:hypothetical protein